VFRAVQFFQSGFARVPMVVGCLKPVLLVPVGFLNSLPPDDIEAILMHELAHIRRGDYAVNLVQRVVELVFFFNPPLLWISGVLRKEREHCCDDIAVAHSGNSRAYINALVAFGEQEQIYRHAAAFSDGSKGSLLQRVKRLIYNHNQTLTTMEKMSLSAAVLAVSVLALAFTGKQEGPAAQSTKGPSTPQEKELRTEVRAGAPAAEKAAPATAPYQRGEVLPEKAPVQTVDTSGKGRSEANFEKDGKKYYLVLEGEKLVKLTENGVEVPESRFGEFKELVQTVLEHRKEAMEHARQAQKHAAQASEHARNAEAFARSATARRQELERIQAEAQEHAREAQQHAEEARVHALEAAEHQKEAQVHAAQAQKHAQVAAKVREELIKDGFIKDKNTPFQFNFSEGKLFFNGVEQPKEVYEKYIKLVNEEKKRLSID
jgi:hypothetical protein